MAHKQDRQFMQLAIQAALECKSSAYDPWVGAVAAKGGKLLGPAYRGQFKAGDHAEYTLLERTLKDVPLVGATVYTTLEPCTARGRDNNPCADWLIRRKVSRVVVGMLDPNPLVSGLGCRLLRKANITVDLFPPDLMAQLEEINLKFIRLTENEPVFQAIYEIGRLWRHAETPLQQGAINGSIKG